jgi:sortase A
MKSLRRISHLLFAISAAAFCYCAFVLGSSWEFQQRASRELAQPVGMQEDLIGRLEIPRLKISVIVAQGSDEATLRKAAGHIEGTAFPGDPGNVGIAAHRDTFFRPLRHIRPNDLVVVETLRGRYCYRVVGTEVVKSDAVGVLAPTAHQILTMVTCCPFYYVGSAPYRFIVRARRVDG